MKKFKKIKITMALALALVAATMLNGMHNSVVKADTLSSTSSKSTIIVPMIDGDPWGK